MANWWQMVGETEFETAAVPVKLAQLYSEIAHRRAPKGTIRRPGWGPRWGPGAFDQSFVPRSF